MRIGLGSYALAWAIGVPGWEPDQPLDVFGFVETAAEHGFGLVQIADNLPLHTLSRADLERLRAHARSLDIGVEVGTRGIADGNLERYLELAAFFGSPVLRVVLDSDGHRPEPSEIISVVQERLPRFEKANVTLAIENHDRFKARDLLGIIRALESPQVGVCLDTVNSFGALEGPGVVIETLRPYVVNLHIKDFSIEREAHGMGFRIAGTPAGQGTLDVAELIDSFRSRKPELSGILELWPDPEPTLAATIEKERVWLKQSAQYLNGLGRHR